MRLFGLDEANKLVPYLQRTFTVMRERLEAAKRLTDQLVQLGVTAEPGAPIADPGSMAGGLQLDRDALVTQMRAELRTLDEMGIEVKGVDGLVDFRARLEGRTVYLCWSFGEARISFWHELETGYSGRQPIDGSLQFDPAYLS